TKLRTRADWVRAGEVAFQTLPQDNVRTDDPQMIRAFRDPKSFERIWMQSDGSLAFQRWLVTNSGVQVANVACTFCHARARTDGTMFWGLTAGAPPVGYRAFGPVRLPQARDADPLPILAWKSFTVPWAPDERIEKLLDPDEGTLLVR